MPRLPARFAAVILCFAPLFFQRSWRHAEVLLLGAILTSGRHTVASILRITGLGRERRFVSYHRVLNLHGRELLRQAQKLAGLGDPLREDRPLNPRRALHRRHRKLD